MAGGEEERDETKETLRGSGRVYGWMDERMDRCVDERVGREGRFGRRLQVAVLRKLDVQVAQTAGNNGNIACAVHLAPACVPRCRAHQVQAVLLVVAAQALQAARLAL